MLVTGSNMSGKSTLLRTVGVNAVMAQTIHTCLAEAYAAPIFTLRSCIGRSDDLLSGKSYYIVEVESLIELVRASQGAAPHLFLLDEMFRGTNAVERIAAGQAVLRELVDGGEGDAATRRADGDARWRAGRSAVRSFRRRALRRRRGRRRPRVQLPAAVRPRHDQKCDCAPEAERRARARLVRDAMSCAAALDKKR